MLIRSMQHMNAKRCCGYKKYWKCADKYPDHMVPVSEFHLTQSSSDGIQGMCKKCFSEHDKVRWKKRPKHPITGEVKKNWKHRIALSYGGVHGTPFWQSYLDAAEDQWQKEVSSILALDLSPNQRGTRRTLPKVDRPKSVRVTTKKVVDSRGYIYIFKDHMKSNDLYKIGASHAPQERLDQANTWGDFESIYEAEEVADCAKLEKEVHQSLRLHQIRVNGLELQKILQSTQ